VYGKKLTIFPSLAPKPITPAFGQGKFVGVYDRQAQGKLGGNCTRNTSTVLANKENC
jgi:hypothetical protein